MWKLEETRFYTKSKKMYTKTAPFCVSIHKHLGEIEGLASVED